MSVDPTRLRDLLLKIGRNGNEDAVKQFLTVLLQEKGFSVQKLPVLKVQTADLKVQDGESTYFIELKSKFDADDFLRQRKHVLSRGAIHSHKVTAPEGENTMSGIIRDACLQLDASQPGEKDFRLIWFVALGVHPQIQIQQFVSALYGRENIIDRDNPSEPTPPCYYFSFNQFFPQRNKLDGAIVGEICKNTFYLNDRSPRAEALRSSRLYKTFGPCVCDPQKQEAEGRAYIADCDADRKDIFAVFNYLREKYNKPNLWHFSIRQQLVTECQIKIPPENVDPATGHQ
jgi:hypothetical protein